jgi:hypothetical protein
VGIWVVQERVKPRLVTLAILTCWGGKSKLGVGFSGDLEKKNKATNAQEAREKLTPRPKTAKLMNFRGPRVLGCSLEEDGFTRLVFAQVMFLESLAKYIYSILYIIDYHFESQTFFGSRPLSLKGFESLTLDNV